MHLSNGRQLWGIALLSLVTGSSASYPKHLAVEERQLSVSVGLAATTSARASSSSSSSTPATSIQDSSTPTPTPTPSSTPTPTPTPTPESSSDTPTPTPTSTPKASSSPAPTSKAASQAVSTSIEALVTSRTVDFVTTIVTVSGTNTISIPFTTHSVEGITTGFATHTTSPGMNGGSGDGGSSGITDNSKKIIGGVVGGIGGAILLGGIGLVAWRLRRKRRNQDDAEDEYLSGGTGSPLREKRQSHGGNTPFQSTLESYHNPAGKPNTSANF